MSRLRLALISRNSKERTAHLCWERLAHLVNEVLPDFVETSFASSVVPSGAVGRVLTEMTRDRSKTVPIRFFPRGY